MKPEDDLDRCFGSVDIAWGAVVLFVVWLLMFVFFVPSASADPTTYDGLRWGNPTTTTDGEPYDHSTGITIINCGNSPNVTGATATATREIPGTETTIMFSGMNMPDGFYYCRANAKSAAGLEGPWSNEVNFSFADGKGYPSGAPAAQSGLELQ